MDSDNNPTALIVGGSSGIGKASAARLVKRGIDVLLLGRNVEKLNRAKRDLGSGGVETVPVDLYDSHAVESLIDRIGKMTRPIRYLVNAAGV
ncbi:MAG: SDR family NAD(P)-dependent oxidoreductase, partial [Desulfobacterales bacterium]